MKRPWRHRGVSLALAIGLAACGARSDKELLAEARQQLAARDPQKAQITLKNVLQKNPELAAARQLLGQTLLELGDAKGAALELRRALELGHPADATVPPLARALLAQGKGAEVIETLSKQSLGAPAAQADLLTTVARAQLSLGRREAAVQTLGQAVAADPGFTPARLLQLRLQAVMGDVAGARAQVAAMLKGDPRLVAAWLLQADLLLESPADPASAQAAYREALALEPDNTTALAGQVRLALDSGRFDDASGPLAALQKAAPRQPQTHELQARLALGTGRVADAREAVQLWLRLVPEDPRALLAAAEVEWRQGARVPAQTQLRKVMANAPDSAPARDARVILARLQLSDGQGNGVLETLAPLLQGAPSAEVLDLAARSHLLLGRAAEARALFDRAAKADPQNVRYRIALLVGELGTARDRSARAQLEALAATDGTGLAAQALASTRLTQRDTAGALAALAMAERLQARSTGLAMLAAQVHEARADRPRARAAYLQALELDPHNEEAVVQLAALDIADGQAVQGLARVRSLLAQQPRSVPLQLAYASLQGQAGARPSAVRETLEAAVASTTTEVEPALALIRFLLQQGSARQALTVAQAAQARFPTDVQITALLGQAHLAAGEAQQAIRSFKQAAAAQPGDPDLLVQLARAHRAAGQPAPAQAVLDELLKERPAFLPALGARLELAIDRQQWSTAQALATAQQKREPARPEGWFWQATLHAAQRQWAPAAEGLRQALARGGGTEVAMRLVSVLRLQGQAAEGDRFATQWLQQRPGDTQMRMALADLAGREGDLATAERHYAAVLEVAPEHAAAMNNLAWVLARQRKPGAVVLAERVNRLHPDRPEFLDTWATALAAEGQPGNAIKVLQLAIEKAPDRPSLWLNLAEVALQAGDKYIARQQLERLRGLGDRFPDQPRVGELMRALK